MHKPSEHSFRMKRFLQSSSSGVPKITGYMQSVSAIFLLISDSRRESRNQAVMVWAGVSFAGTTALHFVPAGQTLTSEYYRDHVLNGSMKRDVRRLFPHGRWTFQQDGAPSHTANIAQQWCTHDLPDFTSKQEWPPSSPDLNPMDYCVWPKLQSMVSGRDYRSIEVLPCLETAWNGVKNWRRRLQACIQQQGGYFES